MKKETEMSKKNKLFTFSNLNNHEGLLHFITSRNGGYSKPPFDSLNLGLKAGDEKDAVIKNRLALADAIGIDPHNFIIPSQCHGKHIVVIDRSFTSGGFFDNAGAIKDTDALITVEKGLCLMVFAADCVPVLVYDPVRKVIAAAHAGWKGTVSGIVSDVVSKMTGIFHSDPEDLLAGIGPSIGPCCYHIGKDVAGLVKEKYGEDTRLIKMQAGGNIVFDLWHANAENLIGSGVHEKNIEISGLCTSCRSDLFFSHRKSGGRTGRFGAGIMLK